MSGTDQGPDPYRPMRAALDQPPAAAAAPAPADPRPLSENARMRALLPIGRSGFAIAAGYLGLFSLIPFVGVLAIAFGLTVLTGAFALGHISGGHFNPAVSVGLWAGGRFPASQLLPYIITQVLGAILAAAVIYLIASGKVSVHVKKGFRSVKVAELKRDDFFGEMALISNEPRSATITAEEVSELFVLQKSDFDKILMKNPAIAQELRQAFFERKAKNK